jgi:hypothetical protein
MIKSPIDAVKFSNTIQLSLNCLTFICMFSFEIKESNLSDARCLIQDVVSSHCVREISNTIQLSPL